jgi:hypothetical protein
MAAGAGNATLQSEIIPDPLPQSVSLPKSDLTSDLALITRRFAKDTPEDHTTSAVLGWQGDTDHAQYFEAVVMRVQIPGSSPPLIQSVLAPLMKDIVRGFCSGTAISRVPKVPASYYVECPQPGGVVINAVAMVRKDQVAVLISDTATMDQKQFDSLAARQYHALHSLRHKTNV